MVWKIKRKISQRNEDKFMIKRIINHIEYRKKVKLLKMIAVNQLTNIIVNNADYVNGFQKLLLTMSKSDDAVELQKLLNDYVDLVKKTKIANDVVNKEEIKIIEGLEVLISRFVGGIDNALFNGYTNIDLSNDLIAFNLQELLYSENPEGFGVYSRTYARCRYGFYEWA